MKRLVFLSLFLVSCGNTDIEIPCNEVYHGMIVGGEQCVKTLDGYKWVPVKQEEQGCITEKFWEDGK